MKQTLKLDGTTYFIHILLYICIDDVLSININLRVPIDKIAEIFRIEEGSIEEPKIYLDANVKKWNLHDETDYHQSVTQ